MAYKIYLDNDKSYFHARTLYYINSEILYILNSALTSGTGLSEKEKNLYIHLVQWRNTFEYYEKKLNPKPSDVFAFEKFPGTLPFPL